MANVVRDLGAI